ncbi:MAG TPA: AMP-binding protein, partial [Nevskia sp.]|nr:AMP-binding protein [Nevskia sp.]
MFGVPRILSSATPDGGLLIRSAVPLRPHARAIGEYLEHWARLTPRQDFLAERDAGTGWRRIGYAEARECALSLGQALLELGLNAERPLAILSGNSVDHALLALGAMQAGIPVAPLSEAYSLLSQDHTRLKTLIAKLEPGAMYVSDETAFAGALRALDAKVPLIVSRAVSRSAATPLTRLLRTPHGPAIAKAYREIGADTVAKILFTSGSTGEPRGVINTHRMLCSNVAAIAQAWPLLQRRTPRVVDWLPWNHTFGGNFVFNNVLAHGGTLYIDRGKPQGLAFQATLENLAEVAPTLYFNVPAGYESLVPHLRDDAALRRTFFSDLELLFSAGAALPPHLYNALGQLARSAGSTAPIVSGWGSTETAPAVTLVHDVAQGSAAVGVPLPGCELKLLPSAGKLEARIKGPNVTPGYWRDPSASARIVDEHGYYQIGDALRQDDPKRPELGLLFDGRIAENFKLRSGT